MRAKCLCDDDDDDNVKKQYNEFTKNKNQYSQKKIGVSKESIHLIIQISAE